ncbi:virulence protein [Streptococcus pneumoniae]|nr:virulence protein [Streptococcus pneumoniae]VPI80263.1 virulence protein [Streptococcus pneumoniae]
MLKSDVTVAKNYLQEKEIRQLERTVTAYFDYIEGLVERRNTFTMRGLADSIDRFLSFNEYEILEGKGSISKKQADSKAIQEYEKFNRTQKILSDFDKHILKIMRES